MIGVVRPADAEPLEALFDELAVFFGGSVATFFVDTFFVATFFFDDFFAAVEDDFVAAMVRTYPDNAALWSAYDSSGSHEHTRFLSPKAASIRLTGA